MWDLKPVDGTGMTEFTAFSKGIEGIKSTESSNRYKLRDRDGSRDSQIRCTNGHTVWTTGAAYKPPYKRLLDFSEQFLCFLDVDFSVIAMPTEKVKQFTTAQKS
jgi:hypothetical protein